MSPHPNDFLTYFRLKDIINWKNTLYALARISPTEKEIYLNHSFPNFLFILSQRKAKLCFALNPSPRNHFPSGRKLEHLGCCLKKARARVIGGLNKFPKGKMSLRFCNREYFPYFGICCKCV